jgi:hypothetical protein
MRPPNPGAKDLIFRGIFSNHISTNGDKNTHNIDKDIDKIFNHLPPKNSSTYKQAYIDLT